MFQRLPKLAQSWVRYCLPTIIILLIALGVAVAGGMLQNFQSNYTGTSINVLNIDGDGGLNISGTGAFNASYTGTSTITGGSMAASAVLYAGPGVVTGGTLSAGTLSVYEPMQGYEYKQLVISCTGGVTATSNTLSITYPTAFLQNTAGTLMNTFGSGVTMTPTAGTGGILTVASTGSTGILVIGGR